MRTKGGHPNPLYDFFVSFSDQWATRLLLILEILFLIYWLVVFILFLGVWPDKLEQDTLTGQHVLVLIGHWGTIQTLVHMFTRDREKKRYWTRGWWVMAGIPLDFYSIFLAFIRPLPDSFQPALKLVQTEAIVTLFSSSMTMIVYIVWVAQWYTARKRIRFKIPL